MELSYIKHNVAQNIYYLRTANNMTQSELGQKLNYSDKAISKWERGDGLPDVLVLCKLGEIFGVSVDYLVSEHTEQERRVETKPIRNIKRQISAVVLWGIIAVAILLMVVAYLSSKVFYWQIIVFSLPVTFIVQIVLACVWYKGRGTFMFTSLLIWSILATIYVALLKYNAWAIFFIGIPAQIIVFICYRININITITKRTSKLFDFKRDIKGGASSKDKDSTDGEGNDGE
ncbi:MAG: helix-turn-helix transcriptional regulator [Clostridia bacterium]|nr:helix-turn-helix transcriptional regulator [Clostridia bacterium]